MPGRQCASGLLRQHARQRAHARPEPRAQERLARRLGGHPGGGQFAGGTKADDLVHRQCARAQATLVAAAKHQRLQAGAARGLHVERADPLGTVELVGGE